MSTDVIARIETDTSRALQFWADYQREHDVSDRKGQAVGIDPHTGRIWFGQSAKDIIFQQLAEGCCRPHLVLRVGYPYYWRKRGRRRSFESLLTFSPKRCV